MGRFDKRRKALERLQGEDSPQEDVSGEPSSPPPPQPAPVEDPSAFPPISSPKEEAELTEKTQPPPIENRRPPVQPEAPPPVVPLPAADEIEAAPAPPYIPPASPPASPPPDVRSGSKGLLIAAGVVIALLAGVVGYLLWQSDQPADETVELAAAVEDEELMPDLEGQDSEEASGEIEPETENEAERSEPDSAPTEPDESLYIAPNPTGRRVEEPTSLNDRREQENPLRLSVPPPPPSEEVIEDLDLDLDAPLPAVADRGPTLIGRSVESYIVYPEMARRAGLEGSVKWGALVGLDGVPKRIVIIRASNDLLASAVREAVRQARYRPAVVNGREAEAEIGGTISFTLR